MHWKGANPLKKLTCKGCSQMHLAANRIGFTRISQAQVCGSLRLRVKPVEMQAPQHNEADMGEMSASLQCMTIIWTAFCLVFSAKLQCKQCSACASMATSHADLTVRTKQMGNEAQGR